MKKKNKGTLSGDNGGGNGGDNSDGALSIQPLGMLQYDDMEMMMQEGDHPQPKPKRSYLFTDEISFLYEAYKPEYWYWEVSLNHVAWLGVVSFLCFSICLHLVYHNRSSLCCHIITHGLSLSFSLPLPLPLSLTLFLPIFIAPHL